MISDKSITSWWSYLMCCLWKFLGTKVPQNWKALMMGRPSTHYWHTNTWTTKPGLYFREKWVKVIMSPFCTSSSSTSRWSIQRAVRLKKATVLVYQRENEGTKMMSSLPKVAFSRSWCSLQITASRVPGVGLLMICFRKAWDGFGLSRIFGIYEVGGRTYRFKAAVLRSVFYLS